MQGEVKAGERQANAPHERRNLSLGRVYVEWSCPPLCQGGELGSGDCVLVRGVLELPVSMSVHVPRLAALRTLEQRSSDGVFQGRGWQGPPLSSHAQGRLLPRRRDHSPRLVSLLLTGHALLRPTTSFPPTEHAATCESRHTAQMSSMPQTDACGTFLLFAAARGTVSWRGRRGGSIPRGTFHREWQPNFGNLDHGHGLPRTF